MKKNILFLSLVVGLFMISCEEDALLDSGNNNNTETQDTTNNTTNQTPTKYLVVHSSNDTVPLFTSSENYSDSTRFIGQANFKDDTYNYALVFTYKAEPLESFEYVTDADRFFTFQSGVENKVNLYLTDFSTGKNYIVESGKAFIYSVSNTEYGYEFNNLTFTNETDTEESIIVSAKVVFTI